MSAKYPRSRDSALQAVTLSLSTLVAKSECHARHGVSTPAGGRAQTRLPARVAIMLRAMLVVGRRGIKKKKRWQHINVTSHRHALPLRVLRADRYAAVFT